MSHSFLGLRFVYESIKHLFGSNLNIETGTERIGASTFRQFWMGVYFASWQFTPENMQEK